MPCGGSNHNIRLTNATRVRNRCLGSAGKCARHTPGVKRYPDVQLEILNLTVDEHVSALLSGTIDVGFVVRPSLRSGSHRLHNSELTSQFICRQALAVVVPKKHKLASRRGILLAQLSGEPYILFRRDSSRSSMTTSSAFTS